MRQSSPLGPENEILASSPIMKECWGLRINQEMNVCIPHIICCWLANISLHSKFPVALKLVNSKPSVCEHNKLIAVNVQPWIMEENYLLRESGTSFIGIPAETAVLNLNGWF